MGSFKQMPDDAIPRRPRFSLYKPWSLAYLGEVTFSKRRAKSALRHGRVKKNIENNP
jgi:hypothetical protein